MQIFIKNFRGIAEASLDINPIALVVGLNGAGKTSIARGAAAAATGKAIPYAGITKKDCAVLLRRGTKTGRAAIGNDEGSTEVNWPTAETASTGKPPTSSPIAAGLEDLFSMKSKEALDYMINLLGAAPTKEDLSKAIPDMPAPIIAKIWEVVSSQGWAAAHKRATETGQQYKGAWQQITGTAYGKKKADEYYPEGWNDALLDTNENALMEKIEAARILLEKEISEGAVNTARYEELRSNAEQLPQLETELADAAAVEMRAKGAVASAQNALALTPNPNAKTEYKCPHCEGNIHISQGSVGQLVLAKAEKLNETDIKKAREKYANASGAFSKCTDDHNRAEKTLSEIRGYVAGAKKAKEELEKIGNKPASNNNAAILQARTTFQNIEAELNIFKKYTEASRVAGQIKGNQDIIDVLDEGGLRKQKMEACLAAFLTKYVNPVQQNFAIDQISLNGDLKAALGSTDYELLSASEQFRVRTVLQLAIAKKEGSGLVVVDGADILDGPSRSSLLNAVIANEIPALICMTVNDAGAIPNLKDMGLGASYWVSLATCAEIPAGTVPAAHGVQGVEAAEIPKFLRRQKGAA